MSSPSLVWTCPVLMTTAMTCCIKLTGVLAVDVDSWTLRRSCLISSWSIRPCATPTAENQFDSLSPLNSPPHKSWPAIDKVCTVFDTLTQFRESTSSEFSEDSLATLKMFLRVSIVFAFNKKKVDYCLKYVQSRVLTGGFWF